jgi:hypothetical protein
MRSAPIESTDVPHAAAIAALLVAAEDPAANFTRYETRGSAGSEAGAQAGGADSMVVVSGSAGGTVVVVSAAAGATVVVVSDVVGGADVSAVGSVVTDGTDASVTGSVVVGGSLSSALAKPAVDRPPGANDTTNASVSEQARHRRFAVLLRTVVGVLPDVPATFMSMPPRPRFDRGALGQDGRDKADHKH